MALCSSRVRAHVTGRLDITQLVKSSRTASRKRENRTVRLRAFQGEWRRVFANWSEQEQTGFRMVHCLTSSNIVKRRSVA